MVKFRSSSLKLCFFPDARALGKSNIDPPLDDVIIHDVTGHATLLGWAVLCPLLRSGVVSPGSARLRGPYKGSSLRLCATARMQGHHMGMERD